MAENAEKAARLKEAYDEFMKRLRGLEHERLEVMKQALGEAERQEIERLLEELKK